MWGLLRAAAIVLLLSVCALAHDTEPINTNFASPFARGAGNLQWRVQWFRNYAAYDLIPIEFEYGFAPRQQFTAGIAVSHARFGSQSYNRLGNLDLEYRLLLAGDNSRRYALSVNPTLELPIGDKRVADSAWRAGGTVNLDTHPAKKWWTHTNVGYSTQMAHISEREKLVAYNNALVYAAKESVRPVVELVGQTDLAQHATQVAVVPEAIVAPNHHWEIKLGIPVGLTESTPSIGMQVGVTWKFGEKGRQ